MKKGVLIFLLLILISVSFVSASECLSGSKCSWCPGANNDTPKKYTLDIRGVKDCTTNLLSQINGNYSLNQSSSPCMWSYTGKQGDYVESIWLSADRLGMHTYVYTPYGDTDYFTFNIGSSCMNEMSDDFNIGYACEHGADNVMRGAANLTSCHSDIYCKREDMKQTIVAETYQFLNGNKVNSKLIVFNQDLTSSTNEQVKYYFDDIATQSILPRHKIELYYYFKQENPESCFSSGKYSSIYDIFASGKDAKDIFLVKAIEKDSHMGHGLDDVKKLYEGSISEDGCSVIKSENGAEEYIQFITDPCDNRGVLKAYSAEFGSEPILIKRMPKTETEIAPQSYETYSGNLIGFSKSSIRLDYTMDSLAVKMPSPVSEPISPAVVIEDLNVTNMPPILAEERNFCSAVREIKTIAYPHMPETITTIIPTFDDGPFSRSLWKKSANPCPTKEEWLSDLKKIIGVLDAKNIRGVFYLAGWGDIEQDSSCYTRNEAGLREIFAEGVNYITSHGHSVGYHAFKHSIHASIFHGESDIKADLLKLKSEIPAGTSVSLVWRCPYDRHRATCTSIGKTLGINYHSWEIDSKDWRGQDDILFPVSEEDVAQITKNSLEKSRENSEISGIRDWSDVLFHVNSITAKNLDSYLGIIERSFVRSSYTYTTMRWAGKESDAVANNYLNGIEVIQKSSPLVIQKICQDNRQPKISIDWFPGMTFLDGGHSEKNYAKAGQNVESLWNSALNHINILLNNLNGFAGSIEGRRGSDANKNYVLSFRDKSVDIAFGWSTGGKRARNHMYKFAGWWDWGLLWESWSMDEKSINPAPKLGMFRFDPTNAYVDEKKLPANLAFYIDVISQEGGFGNGRRCTDSDLGTKGICIDLRANKVIVGHWGPSTPVVKELFNAYIDELLKDSPSKENYIATMNSILKTYSGQNYEQISSYDSDYIKNMPESDLKKLKSEEVARKMSELGAVSDEKIISLLKYAKNMLDIKLTDLGQEGVVFINPDTGEIEVMELTA